MGGGGLGGGGGGGLGRLALHTLSLPGTEHDAPILNANRGHFAPDKYACELSLEHVCLLPA